MLVSVCVSAGPAPYQFLRRKNGVAGILTYERVASIQRLEASAGQSRDHKAQRRVVTSLGFESRRFSWSRDETNTHGIETGPTCRDGNLQTMRCS